MNSDDTSTNPIPVAATPPEPSQSAPAAMGETKRAGIRRPVLIGTALGVGVLLLGGLGVGAIAALNDRETFETVPAAEVSEADAGADASADSGTAASADADAAATADAQNTAQDQQGGDWQTFAVTPGDPASLVAVIDQAVAAAEGTGASSVEVESHGWKVDVILADGSEVDVRVADDGATTVRADHRDDDADPAIDTDRIDDIVAAAIAAAGPGAVTSIETDDGGYDVSVSLTDGPEVDVELAADLSVVSVDRD